MNPPTRNLHQQIIDIIGGRIVSGTHAPGSLLHPDQLEQEIGVSKTVLREALRVLASKGLIESRQKRGTFVRPRADWNLLDADLLRWQGTGVPDKGFLANLGEVRSIMEPAAARLAAQRREEADLADLADALERMAAAGDDTHAAVEADLAFHRALLAAAHNELLTRMEVVIEAGLRVRDHLVHSAEHWADPVPAHRAVMDAVRARDPQAAEHAVQHLLAQATADLDLIHAPDQGTSE
ncbi:FadR/GntR family transcriptional regulator [Streptomyces sp. BE20]|uniref:FadR/GntR family transcriptional regulator n=1 Tax=unclassified Streptomyces TaxID=2593676 RepID=UPI002E7619C8|nr:MULTISPECIES: FadR/GntR family transcriptional regulator [unclassified Streptomyces]MED7947633.1 FadR/GntR family transcriptional regulator [Streptomyces sp. BE303]MEE1825210.1 FadR/GntR family transcriptional regulator [Streptomyces sp. BE20]